MKENINYINTKSILNKVKEMCQTNITKNDIVVDMTVGNGFDTLTLCTLAKYVYGFDIQTKAIENTKKLLQEHNIINYHLFLASHELINHYLSDYKNKIKLVLFNLGYLPKGDKSITTLAKSTLKAFIDSYDLISKDGLILMVFYPHEEGKKEAFLVKDYLNQNNIYYEEYHNTLNEFAPFLIMITKIN